MNVLLSISAIPGGYIYYTPDSPVSGYIKISDKNSSRERSKRVHVVIFK